MYLKQNLADYPVRSSQPQRAASLNRFREKRKERCFEKKIRYTVRKEVALRLERVFRLFNKFHFFFFFCWIMLLVEHHYWLYVLYFSKNNLKNPIAVSYCNCIKWVCQ